MPVIHRFLILLILFSISIGSWGQHTRSVPFNEHIQKTKTSYSIRTGYPATGISVCISNADNFGGAYLVANNDTILLRGDEHSQTQLDPIYSNLYTFSTPLDSFTFYPGKITSEIEFIYIDARLPEASPKPEKKKKSSDCSEPGMIDQEEWREGLHAPDYSRINNTVHNLIIHHTAGSNTDTNYLQVIRNIYIFHTEVRGWSDIGYNYVIAQDGTIFKGRDPGEIQQDNTLGAHFCGSNTGTMGIGIMGTYTEIIPPDTTLGSLISLLNWKAGKDSLDPLGIFPHPLNTNLSVIAGHRDGCATECPGQMLYEHLPELRSNTWDAFKGCGFTAKPVLSVSAHENYYPEINVSDHGITIRHRAEFKVQMYNLLGQTLLFSEIRQDKNQITIHLQSGFSGLAFLVISDKSGAWSELLFLP